MKISHKFDEIRPYYDNEVNQAIKELIEEPDFLKVISSFMPNLPIDFLKRKLINIHSVKQFQQEMISPLVEAIVQKSTDGLSVSGLENIPQEIGCLYISNHRDIVLDSAFLNILLFRQNYDTTEIAIGSNLLIYPWITKLVRLNKSFLVNRNVPVKHMFETSGNLSAYIRHTIAEKNTSVWIAQREGRTKDGNDRTQVSLLKMLNMSGENNLAASYKQLNIVPISISYELESCASFKVKELYERSQNPDFKKSLRDDLVSMGKGMMAPKGRVHFSINKPLNDYFDFESLPKNKNEAMKIIADAIDLSIFKSFKLWPSNYIAYDLLKNSNEMAEHYSKDDYDKFTSFLDKQLQTLKGQRDILKKFFLEIYANPLINARNVSDLS